MKESLEISPNKASACSNNSPVNKRFVTLPAPRTLNIHFSIFQDIVVVCIWTHGEQVCAMISHFQKSWNSLPGAWGRCQFVWVTWRQSKPYENTHPPHPRSSFQSAIEAENVCGSRPLKSTFHLPCCGLAQCARTQCFLLGRQTRMMRCCERKESIVSIFIMFPYAAYKSLLRRFPHHIELTCKKKMKNNVFFSISGTEYGGEQTESNAFRVSSAVVRLYPFQIILRSQLRK